MNTRDKKSVIIFAANWTGGSSLFKLVQELCEGEYIVANPELMTWSRGKELNKAGELVPFIPNNIVYFFRTFEPLRDFIENSRIEPGQHTLVIQARDPADILVAEFYGNTLSHIPQPGLEKKWNRIRKKMIREGVEQYVLRKADALNQNFEWIHSLSTAGSEKYLQLETINYHSFIYDFEQYVHKLTALLDIQFEPGRLKKIIAAHDAFSFITAEDQEQYARNLQRMNRPEEWPFPGRAEMVLSAKNLRKLKDKTPIFQDVFKDSTESVEATPKPPPGAVMKSRHKIWFRYIMKVRFKQTLMKFLRKLK